MPNNEHALVTGSSSGIGKTIAESLLAQGWQVTGFDVAAPAIAHAHFQHVQVDLSDGTATEAAAEALPTLQALVHAAGVLRVAPLGSLQPAGGALMWQLHVDAVTRIANSVLPRMAAAGCGRVVLVGSRVAQGVAGRSQYAATKAALVGLARSWAAEVVAQGVTVNVVSPAATQTAMLADPARQTVPPKLPPMGRLIQPEEVAALVGYLLSPPAAAITGQEIQICGGSSLAR
ncbi:NADP-dependent 3-hydroxy acid dehydrogenase YdfG [Rhodoferax sp. OV413]|uniref:SDR family NAD(P)-dependent oxidoreductase n=1 Tax=Rhodoferax sp. OV413 TaxID=1855285 RepID=UPI00087ED99E|nr:SDR family oxidoreductase [Rhodoferax sp. OV413]SDO71511.1 NADP-dependent 3-hydroxy acid dehydrogenase YdfG [Rhodoferax sp. OV413]